MVLSLDRLTKTFGSKIAVDHLSATMRQGVYGLLGANGAGKTTLMRMICAILEPSSGEVLLDGQNVSDMGRIIVTFWDICHRTLVIIRAIQQRITWIILLF